MILAEDSTLLREGLVRLLAEEGHEVVAAVGSATELLAQVARHLPDVVVTDVRMPPGGGDDGLRAALRIREGHPEVAVLVLSQHVERRYATELLTGGGGKVGYLLKDRVVRVGEFLDAVERVAAGGTVFDPEVVRRLLARGGRGDPLAGLTPREAQVLALMAEGLTNARIAERVHVSVSAVEKHVNGVFDKLGLTGVGGVSRRVVAVVRYLGQDG